MPALITHHLFGEKAANLLPSEIFPTEEHRLAFLLGNQGPDPFFFRFLGAPAAVRAAQALGQQMHDGHVAEAFQVLRQAVEALPPKDRSLGRAFALGLLSHYALDRVAHPYVYGIEYELMDLDKENLGEAESQVHAVIESALDSWMLMQERGVTVKDAPPYKELATTERINRVAGALFSQVAWQVFGINLGATAYGNALANMQTVYKTIEPAGSFKGATLGFLEEKIRGGYSLIQSLAHEIVGREDTPLANMNHTTWKNPWTKKTETDSFRDRFDKALKAYPRLASSFVQGGEKLKRAVANLNYSGKQEANSAKQKTSRT